MKVAYQGVAGAFSHLMVMQIYPDATPVGCVDFVATVRAVETGAADYAVIPVHNSTVGKVVPACKAIENADLIVIAEHDLRIRHQLWGVKGATLDDIKEAHSHPQALAQCALYLKRHGITPFENADTASACQDVARWQDTTKAAIASEAAGPLYGLHKIAADIEDKNDNTTHFVVLCSINK